MPDIVHTPVAKANSQRTQPKVRVGLRAAFTIIFVLICFVLVILWFRSYTWRDRMVVPLTATRFCRIDSDHGKFEFESYGPNMGEMAFSVTALSHADISAAWKRFTDAPQPGPGTQWRWEHSSTGRFFIHIPHWFLFGLSTAIATLPWLPWRFSRRAFSIAIAVFAVMLGFLVWIYAPPQQSDAQRDAIYTDLMDAAKKQEEGIVANRSTTEDSKIPQARSLDFAKLLNSVDDAIGKRLPTPQMDATESATYQYNGPIEKVLDIVAPIANESGFSAESGDLDNAFAQKMKEVMANGVMKLVDHKVFRHPNGEILTLSRMAVGKTGIMMLTITYMNPRQQPNVGENANSHE